MDYNELRDEITSEIYNFGASGFDVVVNPGGAEFVDGEEVDRPEEKSVAYGWVRVPTHREISGGNVLITDKIGHFTYETELKNGMALIIDGERYRIIDAMPVRQVDVTLAYNPILRRVAT